MNTIIKKTIIRKRTRYFKDFGATVRCPICRRACHARPDPSFWESQGLPTSIGCDHLIEVGIPRYADQGNAEFVFDRTKAA